MRVLGDDSLPHDERQLGEGLELITASFHDATPESLNFTLFQSFSTEQGDVHNWG